MMALNYHEHTKLIWMVEHLTIIYVAIAVTVILVLVAGLYI